MVRIEPICRVGIETQMQRMDLWTWWGEGEVEGGMGTRLTHIHYHV